jgi:type VI secretion system protein VasJ
MDLSELSRQPISSTAPAGSDARRTPEFEALQAEVDKLSCPSTAGTVDWGAVARLSSDILRSRSKDMLAAGYLCLSVVHTRGFPGCSTALSCYLELLENFWDDLYPPTARATSRVRALTWWLDRMKSALATLPAPLVAEDSAPIRELLGRLDLFLGAKLENPPSLVPLLEFFASPAPEPAPGQPSADEPGAAIPPAGAVAEAAAPPPASAPQQASQQPRIEEGWGSLNQELPRLTALLYHLREQEPTNPLPYRLLRQITWSGVASLPQTEGGRTRIPAPPAHLRQVAGGAVNSQDAGALLLEAERWLPQFIFWFDLNRQAAQALELLGGAYQTAHDAVCQETAFLLYRLPGLADLCFSDGTPFAGPETRRWLQSVVIGKSGPAPVDAAPFTSCPAQEVDDTFGACKDEMQRLFAAGQLVAGLAAGRRALQSTASGRDNLLGRLWLCEELLANGQAALALPLLEQARNEIVRHRLEHYEPAVALKGLTLSWLALGKGAEPAFKEKAHGLLHRIGRLDLAEMARLILASEDRTAAQSGTAQR